MKPFDHCPICGGELMHKEVEKLLRGGMHSAVIGVEADVCTRCGERLYSLESVQRFEDVRGKLERQETASFVHLGELFKVA